MPVYMILGDYLVFFIVKNKRGDEDKNRFAESDFIKRPLFKYMGNIHPKARCRYQIMK